jgi:hypothetical protein
MHTPILHQHSSYANKTVSWFSSDDKETYDKNMSVPEKQKIIERNGWVDADFTYKFNSHGFRSDEFTDSDAIMFLGCSLTLGTGVPLEVSWTHTVSQQLGLKNYNLGISGGSNDTAFRLANHYVPQIKPKLVVFMGTSDNRFDIITDDEVHTLMYNRVPKQYDGAWYKDWTTYKENGALNWKKNYHGIQSICAEHGSKFIYASIKCYITWPNIDNARDIIHPGVECNKLITEGVLKII